MKSGIQAISSHRSLKENFWGSVPFEKKISALYWGLRGLSLKLVSTQNPSQSHKEPYPW